MNDEGAIIMYISVTVSVTVSVSVGVSDHDDLCVSLQMGPRH